MKKILMGIALLFSFNLASADNLDCNTIHGEMGNYFAYKMKVDNLFDRLSRESEETQKEYYYKLDDVTENYLQRFDRIKHKKYYTIIAYIQCENKKLLQSSQIDEEAVSCAMKDLEIDLDSEKYGKIEKVAISDDGREKLIYRSKGKWESCSCPGGEQFVGMHYVFYYKDNILIDSSMSKNRYEIGFLGGTQKYIISFKAKNSSLDFGEEKYTIEGIIYLSGKNFIFSGEKEKILLDNGIFSKEYDVIFMHKKLEDGSLVLVAGKGKRPQGMGEEFQGKYFIVHNGVEKEIAGAQYVSSLEVCKDQYGYVYRAEDGNEKFVFGKKSYGESKKTKAFAVHGFEEETCAPQYVQILENASGDFGKSKLFLGDTLLFENEGSISEVKILGEDMYYKVFEGVNGNGGGYKLYKNGKKIEERGWVKQYGFLQGGELVYATVYNGNTVIKKGDSEYAVSGMKWGDNLYISENKKDYVFNLRGQYGGGYSNKLFSNGKIIDNNNSFVDGVFIKDDFVSVFTNNNRTNNFVFLNNKKITHFSGNANIVIDRQIKNVEKMNFYLTVNGEVNILECK